MEKRAMHKRLMIFGLLAALTACGGGGTDPITPSKVKVDPYATIFVENITTAAAGARHTTYLLNIAFEPDPAFPSRLAAMSDVAPGEKGCTALAGYVGERLLQVVGVGDTLHSIWDTPPARRDSAALGQATWTGAIRLTTGVFDPLVSRDTTRGHSSARPVKWRWTISDAGVTFVEDSTTVCTYTA